MPPPRKVEPRTGVFVDGANLAGAARTLYGKKVDFGALKRLLVGPGEPSTCVAYVIDNGSDGFQSFLRALKSAGYQVKKRTPKVLPDGSLKADQDVEIASKARCAVKCQRVRPDYHEFNGVGD